MILGLEVEAIIVVPADLHLDCYGVGRLGSDDAGAHVALTVPAKVTFYKLRTVVQCYPSIATPALCYEDISDHNDPLPGLVIASVQANPQGLLCALLLPAVHVEDDLPKLLLLISGDGPDLIGGVPLCTDLLDPLDVDLIVRCCCRYLVAALDEFLQ